MDKRKLTPKRAESSIKTSKTAEVVPSEERKEKLVLFDFDENDCDVIIITNDKEVHLPSSFLVADIESLFDDADDRKKTVDFSSENLIKALSFYYPKYWIDGFKSKDLDDLLSIATTFHLKSFRMYLEKRIESSKASTSSTELDEYIFQILNIAQKHGFPSLIEKIMSRKLPCKSFTIFKNHYFQNLTSDTRLEILKRATLDYFKTKTKNVAKHLEAQTIFQFFDLILCHTFHVTDQTPKDNDFINNSLVGEAISHKKDSKDCVTLIVEGSEILVKSFLLTKNSPVFKAMLHSISFKEGVNKRIELPGKKITEFAYFLQFIRSLLEINDDTNIWVLAPLCQEYQVDWLSDKIKAFVSQSKTNDTKTLLRYLVLTEEMNFGMDVERSLVDKLNEPFPIIHANFQFLLLSRRMQIWIARKSLAKLSVRLYDNLPFYSDPQIVSIFKELDQPNIDYD